MKTIIVSLSLLFAVGIQSFAQDKFNLVPGGTDSVLAITHVKKSDAMYIQATVGADSILRFYHHGVLLGGDPIYNVEQVNCLTSFSFGNEPGVLIVKTKNRNPELVVLEIQQGPKGKKVGAMNFGALPKNFMDIDPNLVQVVLQDGHKKMIVMSTHESSEYFWMSLQGDRLKGYCTIL